MMSCKYGWSIGGGTARSEGCVYRGELLRGRRTELRARDVVVRMKKSPLERTDAAFSDDTCVQRLLFASR